MAGWETLRDGWNLPVYFCDPHSPWQRPNNENSNRQRRFWFPKGTDLARCTQAEFDNACNVVNGQPRETASASQNPSNSLTALQNNYFTSAHKAENRSFAAPVTTYA